MRSYQCQKCILGMYDPEYRVCKYSWCEAYIKYIGHCSFASGGNGGKDNRWNKEDQL